MTTPKFLQIPDFIETNRPRHEPMEAMKRLADPEDDFGAQSFVALGTKLIETPQRPKTLLDMYAALPHIVADSRKRPEHYTDRQHDVITALSSRREASPPVRDDEKNELLLTYLRSTEADQKRRDIITKATAPKTSEPDPFAEATFENQNFGKEIVII